MEMERGGPTNTENKDERGKEENRTEHDVGFVLSAVPVHLTSGQTSTVEHEVT